MTKKIETLSEDIYKVLDNVDDHEYSEQLANRYATRISDAFINSTRASKGPREKGKLWASDLGKRCLRQHWYNFNEPEHGEELDGHTQFKFLYGNILEEAVLYYAEEAGHEVRGQQQVVEHTIGDWTIRGKIDAIIDGVLVDVKSTSSFGFKRYKDGIDSTNDTFGYIEQLGFYRNFIDLSQGEPLVEEISDEAGFVFIDKANGHIQYTECKVPSADELERKAGAIIQAVDSEETQVGRAYSVVPVGKSGNLGLPTACSYCKFKQRCYRQANGGRGLRGFLYGNGPVWLTEVKREPKVPEIKDDE